ncbi:hypothetical protein PGTUg99_009106 [Puccinia graminis f. sp. tritici]|uniref:DUF6589 domain-containing protein n=1 Tax=Puccinia graminis f. sp. tritici TaxID=56615 RepID=A0A5B0S2Q2_PUCGR|nr:hypothetical protein PGTUg99_009106 [Puccinia graminis f. sp. tritici]
MNVSADTAKTISICRALQELNMTPKEFIVHFLTSDNADLASRRRYWSTETGGPSTIALVRHIRDRFLATSKGGSRWTDFIREEAISTLVRTTAYQASSATGTFQSSQDVHPEFFSEGAKARRHHQMTTEEAPFLYEVLLGFLMSQNPGFNDDQQVPVLSAPTVVVPRDPFEAQLLEQEGVGYTAVPDDRSSLTQQAIHLAATMCSMVLFARNRRHNGLQLQNAIRFLACGVSDRVNDYLHKLGLTSSRETALDTLRSLSEKAEYNLTQVSLLEKCPGLGPFICIDNLDMQEKVHMSSVGHETSMFHGTWGYVQIPTKGLLDTLDLGKLNLSAYQEAIKNVPSMSIDPQLFMPTPEAEDHYYLVWISQIAQVMNEYIAVPSDKASAMKTEPPVVEQISNEIPSIYMLKLMDESDDSADGIGQVLEAVQQQTGLTPEEFAERLQPMDGDLATIQNFNSIRDIRDPSSYADHALNNVVFQLGAAHTLWNISQTILTAHMGDPSNENDLGAWQLFQSLGISHEKVLQKKDFTLMIQQMEQLHKATLYHCLR